MKLTKFAIDHSTAVFVLIVSIIIGGFLAYRSLPKEAAPDIQIPVVIVSTPYFGVSPADMETLVTQPLEREFKGLRDIKKMTSTSAESASLITLEFEPDVDIDDALQKIREKVDKAAPDLPEDAEDPQIIEINSSDWPVLISNISGNMDPLRLKEIAEDLKDDIEEVPGVLRVDLAGGVEREIQVNLAPDKLRHYKVSPNQVIGAIQAENVNLPGGSLEMGTMKYTVRVPGEFERVDQLEDIVVKSPESQPIFLGDVATVKDGFKEPETRSRLTTWVEGSDGERRLVTQPNVSLSVVKRSGENIIEIADKTRVIVDRYEDKFATNGLEIAVLNDMSKHIRARVSELENNIISGMVLVLLVLFFFMGGFRNALMVGLSIPMSMLLSFLVLQFMGITLNMVVLFSLVLALGMLVDNAIVIVENIYRHATEGKTSFQAALDGTTEVGWAVIASTATTVGAFFPMLFWPGIMGEFMGYLPLTVIIVLLSSLFVALIINPAIASKFIKVKEGVSYEEDEVPDVWMYRAYRATLEWALDHRFTVVFASFLVLVGTIFAFGRSEQGVEFFPETTPAQFSVSLELPDGTRLERTDKVLMELAEHLDDEPALIEAWITDTGVKGGQRMGGGQAPHYGQLSVDLVDVEDQTSNPNDLMNSLRQTFSDVPGANIIINKQEMGPPSGAPVNIELVGEDLAVLNEIAQEVKSRIRTIPGLIDLQDDVELSRPEIHVVVDRKQAALSQLDTRTIAQTVRTAINGTEASVFREGDEEFDIMVRLDSESRQDVEDIETLTVFNRDKFHVPITEVADIEVRGGSGSIRHKDRDRVVQVTGNNAEGYLATKLLVQVKKRLSGLELPPGYNVRYTGEQQDRKEASEFLGKALLAALFIISLILVTEFNSIVQPMIILFSVILSLIGVFLVLLLTGEPFGIIMTGIGIISLAGVVVNNAIVLVDYTNKLREDKGLERRDSIVKAGLVRFRPVMLTAITTIGGMVPLVIGVSIDFVNQDIIVGGNSVEMWGPMARVVSAGLLVATFLTLVVVPVLYSMFDDVADASTTFFGRLGRVPGELKKALFGASVFVIAAGLPLYADAQQKPAQPQDTEQAQRGDSAGGEAQAEERPSEFRTPEDVEIEELAPGEMELESVDIEASRTLTLNEARQQVRQENYNVRLAQTRVAAADATIRRAYSAILPKISAAGNYIINQEEVRAEFETPEIPGMDQPDTSFLVQPKTTWSWEVGATVPINGRAYPGIKIANAQKDLASSQLELTREELEFAVTQTYYNLLGIRRVIEIAQQQLESARTLVEATRRRFEAGVATKFELTRAELRVVQNEKEVERARLQFVQARESLAQLVQTEADFDIVVPTTPTLDQELSELEQRAAQKRVAVEVERINQHIAQLTINEVYYQYLPDLSATFKYSDVRDTDLNPQPPQWQLIFGANWLLWDGGAREATLDERQAQLIASRLQAQQTLDQIETELEQAWASYLSAQSQVEAAASQVELAEEALQQARIAYQYGTATQLDLLDADDRLQVARLGMVRDRLQLELAIQRLKYLAGIK